MGVLQRGADLVAGCAHLGQRQGAAGLDAAGARRRRAGDVVHDDEGEGGLALEAVEAHDVGVVEASQRLGLALEAAHELRVLGQVLAQHLDGDVRLRRFGRTPGRRRPCRRGRPACGSHSVPTRRHRVRS